MEAPNKSELITDEAKVEATKRERFTQILNACYITGSSDYVNGLQKAAIIALTKQLPDKLLVTIQWSSQQTEAWAVQKKLLEFLSAKSEHPGVLHKVELRQVAPGPLDVPGLDRELRDKYTNEQTRSMRKDHAGVTYKNIPYIDLIKLLEELGRTYASGTIKIWTK